MPGATPFQDKLKEYELKAPTVGMFGEISKDGESILEIAAWKRADEYCTFFASKPQVALSRIKQQMHREVGHSNMLQIVRNIRDNMEFLELPGGGTHGHRWTKSKMILFPFATQATEPAPGASIEEPRVRNTNLAA